MSCGGSAARAALTPSFSMRCSCSPLLAQRSIRRQASALPEKMVMIVALLVVVVVVAAAVAVVVRWRYLFALRDAPR